MADGKEEREQQEQRREQEKRKNREDWLDRGEPDPSEPERGGS